MFVQKSNIYLEYEIPLAMRASVIPIENLEEKLTKDVTEDPTELKELIYRYDAAVPIGITRDYIDKRGFDTFKSLREIVQNTLDEVELITGKPDVNIEKNSFGTWIIDKGRGLSVDALSIGSTNKECWMRGYYGEGLKLATAYFTLKDIPVYIFTKNNVFKFVAMPKESENPRIFVLLGKLNLEVEGTKVLLFGFNIENDTLDKMVSFRNKDLAGKKVAEVYSSSSDCPHKKASAIYDYPNLLYIRNMFVGNMDQVTKRKSLFSYDLWWFRLDVSRTLVTYSMPRLFEEVAKVFEASRKGETKLAGKLLETNMLTTKKIANGFAIEFRPTFSIFEGHLFVYSFPKGMLDAMLEVLHLKDKKHLVARATGKEDLEGAVKNGIIPFIVSEEFSEEFKRIRPLSELSK